MDEKRLPTNNTAMVAFIDLLGFKDRLNRAESKDELQQIYLDLQFVHDQFGKIPDSDDSEKSKRVLAFSDAIVVAIDFDSDLVHSFGVIDAMAIELHSMGMAQAICHAKGIFLRGCVSMGQFFSEGDFLISKALASAYEEETKSTVYPIIKVEDSLAKRLKNDLGNDCYAEDNKPLDGLLSQCVLPSGENIEYIDYLSVAIDATADWYCEIDRQNYLSETRFQEKDRLLSESYRKNQIHYLSCIGDRIAVAIKQEYPPKVAEKYEWSAKYFNALVECFCPERKDLPIASPEL